MLDAMQQIPGYLDISSEDFRNLYQLAQAHASERLARALNDYLRKLRGSTRGAPPRVSNIEVLWSWLGSFLGIALLAWLNDRLSTQGAEAAAWLDALGLTATDGLLLIGSFGASAVLLYGAPRSPLAQPRNLLGGHALSALIGVSAWLLLGPVLPWLAAALAVSTAIAAMHLTRTLHPPGGATALIAVIGSEQVHAMGYLFALLPVTLGALLMLLVALLVNNLSSGRRYPEFWF
ncbi:MAG: HPP family protein [Halochromatium sp.]